MVDIPCIAEDEREANSSKKLLEFALSRETEVIDIRVVYSTHADLIRRYFLSTSIIKNNASSNSPLHGLRFLKELSLRGVAMYNGDIMVLLRNLVVLERLLLESCTVRPLNHYNLVIDGPSTSKLQRLIISGVSGDLYAARVSNLTNLISLRCDRMSSFYSLDLHNLPKLVRLRILSAEDCIFGRQLPKISCDKCDRLRRLELGTRLDKYVVLGFERHCLRQLEMNVFVDKEECDLHRLFSLVEACPRLNKLEIKLIWVVKPKYKQRIRVDGDRVNMITRIDNLRTMKLSEFCGTASELEFVLCVLNNGVDLQELSLEACASNSAIQQREIANSYKRLISVAPTFVDLILK